MKFSVSGFPGREISTLLPRDTSIVAGNPTMSCWLASTSTSSASSSMKVLVSTNSLNPPQAASLSGFCRSLAFVEEALTDSLSLNSSGSPAALATVCEVLLEPVASSSTHGSLIASLAALGGAPSEFSTSSSMISISSSVSATTAPLLIVQPMFLPIISTFGNSVATRSISSMATSTSCLFLYSLLIAASMLKSTLSSTSTTPTGTLHRSRFLSTSQGGSSALASIDSSTGTEVSAATATSPT